MLLKGWDIYVTLFFNRWRKDNTNNSFTAKTIRGPTRRKGNHFFFSGATQFTVCERDYTSLGSECFVTSSSLSLSWTSHSTFRAFWNLHHSSWNLSQDRRTSRDTCWGEEGNKHVVLFKEDSLSSFLLSFMACWALDWLRNSCVRITFGIQVVPSGGRETLQLWELL